MTFPWWLWVAAFFAACLIVVLLILANELHGDRKPREVVSVDLVGAKPTPLDDGWDGDFRSAPPVSHGLDHLRVVRSDDVPSPE